MATSFEFMNAYYFSKRMSDFGCRISGALSEPPALATFTETPELRHPKSDILLLFCFPLGLGSFGLARCVRVFGRGGDDRIHLGEHFLEKRLLAQVHFGWRRLLTP